MILAIMQPLHHIFTQVMIAFQKLLFLSIAAFPCLVSTMSAAKQAFPKTGVGEIEIKVLPAATLIASRSDSEYFEEDNRLFRPLFRYIQQNDIPMTTPVEAEIDPGVMYFYIDEETSPDNLEDGKDVAVIELPERRVASIGARGSYSQSNFEEAAEKLSQWLADHPEYEVTGSPRGIYWNGPMTLWFLKRFEVHIPVRESVSDVEGSE